MEIDKQEQDKVSRCIDCDKYALWSRTIRNYVTGADDCLHHHKIVRWDDGACWIALEQGWLEKAKILLWLIAGKNELIGKRRGIYLPSWASTYLDSPENQPVGEFIYAEEPKHPDLRSRLLHLIKIFKKGDKGG